MSATPPVTQPVTPVDPLHATLGSIFAGIVGYVTTVITTKYHIPAEIVSGILTLVGSGAMALWHQSKS